MTYLEQLQQHNTDIRTLIGKANELPDVGASGGADNSVNAFLEGTLEEVNCAGVIQVYPYTFYENPGLKKVALASAGTVGNYNFYNCLCLRSIDLPNATEIGTYFGYSCLNLMSVKLPKASALNNYSFQSSSGIQIVDLPMAESIANYCFRYCTNLKAVVLRKIDSICTLGGSGAFAGSTIASGNGYIYVPSTLIEDYKAATNWSKYSGKFRALESYTVDGTITGALDENKM